MFSPSKTFRCHLCTSLRLAAFSFAVCTTCHSTIALAVAPTKSEVQTQNAQNIPEIDWGTTLKKFQFDADKFIGQRLTMKCPPVDPKLSLDGLIGTDRYPSDSPLCLAALHAGKIGSAGGFVTVQLTRCEDAYQGSVRAGVSSADRPKTPRSFIFVDDKNIKEADKLRESDLPRIKWDTKFTSTGFAYRHLIGQQISFRVPEAPANLRPRLIYGTDRYDFASRIAIAALHAGAIDKDGGVVTVKIEPGTKLIGSIRNGIESKSKGGGDRTISFVMGE